MWLCWLVCCLVLNPCDAYVAALVECIEQGGGSVTEAEVDESCGDVTAEQAAVYADWYACQQDAYADADCSTAEGRGIAADAATTCVPPDAE